jgi:hypothetical protein
VSEGIQAEFDLDLSADWRLIVLRISNARVEVMYPRTQTVKIPAANRFSEIVFIPMVTDLDGEGFQYDYVITTDAGITRPSDVIGDFDGNNRVDFGDFLQFAGGFRSKATTVSHSIQFDMNGDGSIDFSDFLIFAQYFQQTAQP